MPREEENYVALFIDWDNLAISTAVDFAGAVPDVRAIVRAAQRSGTVLLARAYAEWNVSSDRLSVYRAGIEPVYAPTFRFEPEPGSQVPRGKSLADPCLVTDCIDTMHLMPTINVFVLVSGDKDLIPIVRLAQLRGKRVVVIGPDFVAAILREMADEYIPYRVLAESSETAPTTEVSVHGARGQRRVPTSTARAAPLPAATPVRAQPAPAPARGIPPPIPMKPMVPEVNGNAPAEEVVAATTIAEPLVEPVPAEEVLDTGPLFETIGAIVREREQSGKPKLRATNLKDQLLARIPGFNERKYGFLRFKDLLASAEKAGVIVVSRTGPVQWVAAVNPPASAPPPPVPVAPLVNVAPVETPSVPTPAPAPPPSVEATPRLDEDVDAEVVRFILDLRRRSRWLTYTYLLTNLLNHLGKGSADAAADAAARTTLNRLVQSGVLIVDREPREIDVNGTRHRVRLCHIVDEHPLVEAIREQMAAEPESSEAPAEAPSETASEGPQGEATTAEPASLEAVASPSSRSASTFGGTETEAASEVSSVEPAVETVSTDWTTAADSVPVQAAAEGGDDVGPEVAVGSTTNGGLEAAVGVVTHGPLGREEVVPPGSAGQEPLSVTEWVSSESASTVPSGETPATAVTPEVATEVTMPAIEQPLPTDLAPVGSDHVSADVAHVSAPESTPVSAVEVRDDRAHEHPPVPAVMSLSDSYQILREVVREATGPTRPSTGPAAVKNRLVRRLGAFDEHAFGFSKFKDYLLSAERAGAVRVELVGTSARVSLPVE